MILLEEVEKLVITLQRYYHLTDDDNIISQFVDFVTFIVTRMTITLLLFHFLVL